MITKQDIKNYSAREDLPGELLIEIIIGKSVDELEGCRQGHTMYPDLSPKDIQKAFPAYKTLSTGIINRFHKEPSTQSAKGTRKKLKDAIPLKEFCCWFCEENLPSFLKKQSRFALSYQAKRFIKLVQGGPLATLKKQSSRHTESNEHKKEVCKVANKLWREDKSMTIADMVISDEINLIKKKDGTNYSERTLRNWIRSIAPSNKPGRRPQND